MNNESGKEIIEAKWKGRPISEFNREDLIKAFEWATDKMLDIYTRDCQVCQHWTAGRPASVAGKCLCLSAEVWPFGHLFTFANDRPMGNIDIHTMPSFRCSLFEPAAEDELSPSEKVYEEMYGPGYNPIHEERKREEERKAKGEGA